jgi:hypothetical protein
MNTNSICNETITIERLFLEEKKISPHLICFICKKVFNNPVLIDCGHTFCYSCITKKLKENGGFCPKCHFKNFSCKISRDLLAYNLVMELEVSCNNVGKCPWIGHLSELVAHQNLCDKTLKILENNKKKYVENISKRFSFDNEKSKKTGENINNIFCNTEYKNKNDNKINLNLEIDNKDMIKNLEKIKQKFLNKSSNKKREIVKHEEIEEIKKLFL